MGTLDLSIPRDLHNLPSFLGTPRAGLHQVFLPRCRPPYHEVNRIHSTVSQPRTRLPHASVSRSHYQMLQPTVLDFVQRFHGDSLLLRQFPRVVVEGPKIRPALTEEGADCACGCPATLARDRRDSVAHEFAGKV